MTCAHDFAVRLSVTIVAMLYDRMAWFAGLKNAIAAHPVIHHPNRP